MIHNSRGITATSTSEQQTFSCHAPLSHGSTSLMHWLARCTCMRLTPFCCFLLPQVVLPDKDRSDADVVVFLAEEHAAHDDTEAQQRGAVCTLQHVTPFLPDVLARQSMWQNIAPHMGLFSPAAPSQQGWNFPVRSQPAAIHGDCACNP